MKTTIELPDRLFRKVKAQAAFAGLSLKSLITKALEEMLTSKQKQPASEPQWLPLFGALKSRKNEIRKIQKMIDHEFSKINPEDWK